MKSWDAAFGALKAWRDNGCVGNFILFHPPGADGVDYFVERTIKLRETTERKAAAVAAVLDLFDCHRAELFRNNKGVPDRIKVTRFKDPGNE